MRRQVILEAKILEVTLSEAFQSGINWTAIGNPGINKTIVASQGPAALANAWLTRIRCNTGGNGYRRWLTAPTVFLWALAQFK